MYYLYGAFVSDMPDLYSDSLPAACVCNCCSGTSTFRYVKDKGRNYPRKLKNHIITEGLSYDK